MAPLIPCAGAVVSDGAGRLLLIRRGRPPSAGLWSIPGGRVEPGESPEQAARREVWEETGARVAIGPLLGRVVLPGLDGDEYDVRDFAATLEGGADLVAGDDAADARWVTRAELTELALTPGLAEALDGWGVWD